MESKVWKDNERMSKLYKMLFQDFPCPHIHVFIRECFLLVVYVAIVVTLLLKLESLSMYFSAD